MLSDVMRDKIVAEARTWIGVPWKHQGRTRIGIDCVGLLVVVLHKLKLTDYDFQAYGRRSQGREFLYHFERRAERKPLNSEQPGDILLFRDKQFPCHAAIVASMNNTLTIIHAHALRRAVVEDRLNQGDWISRRVACFEVRGI